MLTWTASRFNLADPNVTTKTECKDRGMGGKVAGKIEGMVAREIGVVSRFKFRDSRLMVMLKSK